MYSLANLSFTFSEIFQKGDKKNGEQPLFEREQVKNAKEIMRPFVLRRLKNQVLRDLPDKKDEIIRCALIEKQQSMYNKLVAQFSAEASEITEVNGTGMMMQLRKLANHPLLVRDYYNEKKLEVFIIIIMYTYIHVYIIYMAKKPEFIF